jgi:hypothetical protein
MSRQAGICDHVGTEEKLNSAPYNDRRCGVRLIESLSDSFGE